MAIEVLPATDMFGPLPGDDYIVFADDIAKTQASFARFSAQGRGDLSGIRPLPDGVGQDHAQAAARDAARSVVAATGARSRRRRSSSGSTARSAASCSASSTS